jgi:hypothetical protein
MYKYIRLLLKLCLYQLPHRDEEARKIVNKLAVKYNMTPIEYEVISADLDTFSIHMLVKALIQIHEPKYISALIDNLLYELKK